MKPKNNLKLALIFSLIIFGFVIRFWNIEATSRFIWDESSDLVKIQDIWTEKKITILGPISEDGNKIFSSLTYYMLLPFAILGNFDPISPVYGAIFWGMITVLLLLILINDQKINPWKKTLAMLMVTTWTPLLVTSRWAWNPNLIPFWVTLSFLLYKKFNSHKLGIFLSSLTLGMTIHHHYLAAYLVIICSIIILVTNYVQNKKTNILLWIAGSIVAVLPFAIFDLTHPPGLFISRILYFNYLDPIEKISTLAKFKFIFLNYFKYISGSNIIVAPIILLSLGLILLDLKQKNYKAFILASICTVYLLLLGTVTNVYEHYFLPIIVLYFIWIISKRTKTANLVNYLLLIFILSGSLLKVPAILTDSGWESNIKATREIVTVLENEINHQKLTKPNIAVLASDDPNIYGRKYRDLILTREKIKLLTKDEYYITDNLFVISTSDEQTIRKDPAVEMDNFRNGKLIKVYHSKYSNWKIYQFDKNNP